MSLNLHPLTVDELILIGEVYLKVLSALMDIDGRPDFEIAPVINSINSSESPFSEVERKVILAGLIYGRLNSNKPYVYHTYCNQIWIIFKIIDGKIKAHAESNEIGMAEKVDKANEILRDLAIYQK